MDKFKLETPVLFVVFNRLDTVKKTLKEISKVKPSKIFIAADGPRTKEEKIKTDAVRKYILNNINWKCVVKTRFLSKNLGCKEGVSSAIDWFFKNVKKGIILEDDCVPNESFFRFSEEMLNKYEKNPKIFSINGYNHIEKLNVPESYYFSKYYGCWGWSTWRDRWFAQDKTLEDFQNDVKTGKFKEIFKNPVERIWAKRGFRNALLGKVSAWDYSFGYLHFKKNGLCIKPKVNLLKNIGFMEDSTHTSGNFIDNRFYCVKTYNLKFPLIHPKEIKANLKDSKKFFRKVLSRIFLKRIFFL
ncbi:nucleotide-diphospho-sugar transferase [Candidatus Pacearchaeota archaeon]|nr:nucleotide-diphospho-sugar transferase [Candidatus Pacearchaeota archaeon]